jgi:hypothetical protein
MKKMKTGMDHSPAGAQYEGQHEHGDMLEAEAAKVAAPKGRGHEGVNIDWCCSGGEVVKVVVFEVELVKR